MTYSGRPGSLIEDVITSSRGGSQPSGENTRQPAGPEETGSAAVKVFDPAYAALLARILAEQPAAGTPCVQFMACQTSNTTCQVAFGTARAGASLMGRTLLLNTRTGAPAKPAGGELEQIAPAPMPDAFTQRLYHRRLLRNDADLALLYGRSRKDALCTIAAPFRLVVIDAGVISDGHVAEGLARFCLGTVLVVVAGRTTKAAVNHTRRHVSAAGGKVIGTVLTEAPADLPPWIAAR